MRLLVGFTARLSVGSVAVKLTQPRSTSPPLSVNSHPHPALCSALDIIAMKATGEVIVEIVIAWNLDSCACIVHSFVATLPQRLRQ